MEKKSLLKIEQIEIEKIIPREKNPRIHSEKQIQEIKNNIERFDFTEPVHVDENNILLSGHGRCEAAKIVGLTHLPAIRKTGLSEIEKKAYVITHNKIGLNSEWDNQIVLDDIAEIEKNLGDIEFLGFEKEEIEYLKDVSETEPLHDMDYSLLDGDAVDKELAQMAANVKKAIQIEFESDDYEQAVEVIKKYRQAEAYIGGILLQTLLENEKEL